MNEFVIGELVIMQNATFFTQWNSALGVVIGLLQNRRARDLSAGRDVVLDAYQVRILDRYGIAVTCERHQMKKLPMPARESMESGLIEREQSKPELVE